MNTASHFTRIHPPSIKLTHLLCLGKSGALVAIDEITGFLSHTDTCKAKTKMKGDPRAQLHPDLRKKALDLVRRRAPLAMIQQKVAAYAAER